jgi:hypothetical protein
MNAQMQNDIVSFFETATLLMKAQNAGPSPQAATPSLPLSVEITNPDDGGLVSLRETVNGYVLPAASNVQVLVYSPEKRWYPQGPVKRRGTKWQVRATFGRDDSADKVFRIVAVISDTVIREPILELPEGAIKSEIVIVTRYPAAVKLIEPISQQ